MLGDSRGPGTNWRADSTSELAWVEHFLQAPRTLLNTSVFHAVGIASIGVTVVCFERPSLRAPSPGRCDYAGKGDAVFSGAHDALRSVAIENSGFAASNVMILQCCFVVGFRAAIAPISER